MLDQGTVALGHLVHVDHGAVDLFRSARLFGTRRHDLGDDVLTFFTDVAISASAAPVFTRALEAWISMLIDSPRLPNF